MLRCHLLMNSPTLSQLSLEKEGNHGLLKMEAEVLAWGKRKGKQSGCDYLVFVFLFHSVGILRVADLREEGRG